ncbi:hypothetical protein [Agrobacterium pusense]|uniref:hypothetical protein n=1 Tax=Agrobacterium pusense TaxID=648995 RepID=UPI0032DB6AD2
MGEFKKGDFVRVRPGKGTKLLKDEGIYEVLGHSVQGHPILPVTTSGGTRINLDYSAERLTLWRRAPEQPATLKIEAGKFYKTRDGRKVGPMAAWHRGGWASEGEFLTGLWLTDGQPKYSNASDSPALIAEWIDEPAAKPSNDNAKPNFKVGDRVRSKAVLEAGIGVVIGLDPFQVDFKDTWYRVCSESPDSIELITKTTPTTAIVALVENGQPKPSSSPHVHASTGAAEKEAKRLAAKYKGKQFGVFTLTTTHEEAAPVYDHKWQNMAALGLKIDAIKELRAVAGLDLLSAKRAVEAFENAA